MEKEKLKLIPKSERYIQYIIELIIKLPRTEKFSIGNEYKSSLYNMLENIMYLNKTIRIKNSNETTRNDKNNFMKKVIEQEKYEKIKILNKIDCMLNCQRIYLRIMYKNKWIDEHKLDVAMSQIYEIGQILGGLIKYYAKNY